MSGLALDRAAAMGRRIDRAGKRPEEEHRDEGPREPKAHHHRIGARVRRASSSSAWRGRCGAQDEKLILDVVSLRPGDSEEAFHAFDAQVTQFEEANPDIDIVAHEYNWTGPTFAAMLAGGTLPDVFTIPFTDGRSLIEQGQLADITDLVKALPYGDTFNPNVLATVQDDEGHIYGLPRQALRHRAPVQPPAVRAGRPRP